MIRDQNQFTIVYCDTDLILSSDFNSNIYPSQARASAIPPRFIPLCNSHWWPGGKSSRLLHWWQNLKIELIFSSLAFLSTPCGHPSSEIPMHPDHYCKRCTTYTSCCCGSWCLLSDLWYLIQQAFQSPILEAHLWTSWVCCHYNHLHLTQYMTLLYIYCLSLCGGFYNKISPQTC